MADETNQSTLAASQPERPWQYNHEPFVPIYEASDSRREQLRKLNRVVKALLAGASLCHAIIPDLRELMEAMLRKDERFVWRLQGPLRDAQARRTSWYRRYYDHPTAFVVDNKVPTSRSLIAHGGRIERCECTSLNTKRLAVKLACDFGHRANFDHARISDHATFSNAHFGDSTSFYRATFGECVSFRSTSLGHHANFSHATFGDQAFFGSATLGDRISFRGVAFGNRSKFSQAIFGDHASFEHATLGDHAIFGAVTFGDRASFKSATLGEHAGFGNATLGDYANFENANFSDGASFFGASLGSHARFFKATLGDHAMFFRTTFGDVATFGLSTFGDGASFRYATFKNEANFNRSSFGDNAKFGGTIFKGDCRFNSAAFSGDVSFMHVTVEKSANFEQASITGSFEVTGLTLFRRLQLRDATFGRGGRLALNGLLALGDATLEIPPSLVHRTRSDHRLTRALSWFCHCNPGTAILGEDSDDPADLRRAAEDYDTLAANFRKLPGTDREEDRCLWRAHELRRVADLHEAFDWKDGPVQLLSPKRVYTLFRDILVRWLIMRTCLGYLLHPDRIMVSGAAVVLGCMLIYLLGASEHTIAFNGNLPPGTTAMDLWRESGWSPLYFSLTTFVTLGYGDFAPKGWFKLVTGVQALLGVTLIALFTVAWGRKMIRS